MRNGSRGVEGNIVDGLPERSDLVVLPLGEETATPLCTPSLAVLIRRPQDIVEYLLTESNNKQIRWDAWFAANGLTPPQPPGMRFDRSFLPPPPPA